MIDKKALGNGTRLYIKTDDGDLLFDKNYNIRWSKRPEKVLKWFQGGVMVRIMAGSVYKYQQGYHWQQVYPNARNEQDARLGEMQGQLVVSGLYTYADSLKGASYLNSDMINIFFGYYMGREWSTAYGGRMEIIVFNDGLPVDINTGKYNTGPVRQARGLQSYMDVHNNGYTDGNSEIWNIKGSAPERYQPFLHASQLYTWHFRWAAKAYTVN